ncbi:tetratricopeptide repeat protein [Alloacidobacterium dinghuense]|uniref:Tetratricopeptide repeat protein n=1 Tax=Alloacidobacterium dinghuense TaxID=2763107 RepID=A0A7G8BCG6_9BACT|nr:tetratricopeptide repeat protein [Alloacidobacterium dinghuense]QNI30236.1 tetratricopeptide repeat protein [Alloacidobacterium dinghuense]
MRRLVSVPVLALVLSVPGAFAQQQQSSSDPYASPPPPPQAPSTQPDKGCSGQATRGDKGPWKASSTCPPASDSSKDAPALQPAQNSAQQPKKSTADDNPFPEDISEKAAADAKARDSEAAKPAPAATGESSSRDKLDNLDLEGDRDTRIADGAGGVVHNPKLAADDVHVGQFYLNREDYKGAYARFKEATLADPENPEAVFYLAEAARRMNHRDEAVTNYQLYLAALPDGPKAKEAHKALRDLSASAKH